VGSGKDLRLLQQRMGLSAQDSAGKAGWAVISNDGDGPVRRPMPVSSGVMPSVEGMGLRDAIFLLENLRLKVVPVGSGRVKIQSVEPGTPIMHGQTITLEMSAT
jgi:cell division protein FtsI (penicillin-binding protein 3)